MTEPPPDTIGLTSDAPEDLDTLDDVAALARICDWPVSQYRIGDTSKHDDTTLGRWLDACERDADHLDGRPKETWPLTVVSGWYRTERRGVPDLPNPVVGLDYDHLEHVADIVAALDATAAVLFAAASYSGHGLRVLVLVEPWSSAREYRAAWTAAAEHVAAVYAAETGGEYGDLAAALDRGCSDAGRGWFPHRGDAASGLHAHEPVAWTLDDAAAAAGDQTGELDGREPEDLARTAGLLDRLDAVRCDDRSDWLRVLMALKSEHGDTAEDLARRWSSGSAKYDADVFARTWASLDAPADVRAGAVRYGTLVELARLDDPAGDYDRSKEDTGVTDDYSDLPPLPAGVTADDIAAGAVAQRRPETEEELDLRACYAALLDMAQDPDEPPPEPLVSLEDGTPLLFSGRRHLLYGESDAGKTWVALWAAVAIVRAGGRVLWLDSDDSLPASRITQMGATDVLDGLRMTRDPDDRTAALLCVDAVSLASGGDDTRRVVGAQAWIAGAGPSLVVIDTVNGTGAPIDGANLADWFARWVTPWRKTGAATLLIDHLAKAKKGEGHLRPRGPKGSGTKLEQTDYAYRLDLTRLLTCERYRHGRSPGKEFARLIVTERPDTDGAGTVSVTVAPNLDRLDDATSAAEHPDDAALLDALRCAEGPCSTRELSEEMSLHHDRVTRAAKRLRAAGRVTRESGPRGAHLWTLADVGASAEQDRCAEPAHGLF